MRLGVEGGGDGRDRHGRGGHELEQERAGRADAEIGEPALPFRDEELALRPQKLDQRHRQEHACEDGKANKAVALSEEAVHAPDVSGEIPARQCIGFAASESPTTPKTTKASEASFNAVTGSRK